MLLIPGFEDAYEIEIAHPAADNECRNSHSHHDDQRTISVCRAQHDERQPIEITLKAFDEHEGKAISDSPAYWNSCQSEDCEHQQQQAGDFIFGKSEHTQTREFPRTFGELDAGTVVNDAKGDDCCQTTVNGNLNIDILSNCLLEFGEGNTLQCKGRECGLLSGLFKEGGTFRGIEKHMNSADARTFVEEAVERGNIRECH